MSDDTTRAAIEAHKMLDEGYPEAWIWDEHGDRIVGVIRGLEVGMTKYGKRLILIIELDSGNLRSVWVTNEALFSKLKDYNPQTGEVIGIERGEVKTSAGGNDYREFRVVMPGRSRGALSFAETAMAALNASDDTVAQGEIVENPPPNIRDERPVATQGSWDNPGAGSGW